MVEATRLVYTDSRHTNQLQSDGCADGQPRVDHVMVEDEKLVRSAPYADDEGGGDEHVQEHVEHGERAIRPRRVDRTLSGPQ